MGMQVLGEISLLLHESCCQCLKLTGNANRYQNSVGCANEILNLLFEPQRGERWKL